MLNWRGWGWLVWTGALKYPCMATTILLCPFYQTFLLRQNARYYLFAKMLIKKSDAVSSCPMRPSSLFRQHLLLIVSVSRRPLGKGREEAMSPRRNTHSGARPSSSRGPPHKHRNNGPDCVVPVFRWGHNSMFIRPTGQTHHHRAELKVRAVQQQPSPRCLVCSQRLSRTTGPGEGITRRRS